MDEIKPDMSHEVTLKIINEITKLVTYLEVDTQEQIKLRNVIEIILNDYEITSRCTALTKCDILEKAFVFLASKKLEGMMNTTRYNYSLLFKKMNLCLNKPINTLTTTDLRMFLAIEYKNNQPNSLNDKINKLRSFFGWLQDEGYIITNPSKNLKPIKEPYRRRGHIEQVDIERIRNTCETTREKSIINFLFATGCRVSEVSNAKIDKINWQENSIVVIGKGDKERKVYFDAKTRLCLLNYIDEREQHGIYSNDLFVAGKYPYAKLGSRSIERDFGDIVTRAGITEHYSCHHARHSFATVAVNKSVPINVLSQILGHSQLTTTQLYYDNDETNIKQEYRKIAL